MKVRKLNLLTIQLLDRNIIETPDICGWLVIFTKMEY